MLTIINKDKVKFMKAKAQYELSVVRMLMAEIQNERIKTQKDLTDEDIFVIIKRMIKQIGESKDYAIQGGRSTAEFEVQLDVLNRYLPKQLTQDEIKVMAQKIINDGVTNMGTVMKGLMPLVKGKADNKIVSDVVKDLLK